MYIKNPRKREKPTEKPKKKHSDISREEIKESHIKCSVNTREHDKGDIKKNKCNRWKTVTQILDFSTVLSIIALNVNTS